MKTAETALVTCPQCQSRYSASITSILDVSNDPTLKQTFLRGGLNISQCPQCRFTGELKVPLLYHDQAKELALVFTPRNLQLSHADSQKIIGDLTNRLMKSLPPEKRKAYLLTPKTFLTLNSLKKAVLEADGITKEMLQSQAAKVELLQKMLRVTNPDDLKKMVETHDAELDRQFFEILSGSAFNALANGEQEQAQGLLSFRQMIAEWSSRGKGIVAEIDKIAGFQAMTPEALLENLMKATGDEEFVNLIRSGKPLIDYGFFQNLTGQIEALEEADNTTEAEKLKSLRSRILETSAQIEEENRKQIGRALQLLNEVTQISDLSTFVSENITKFDEVFFSVLAANIQEAAKQGQKEAAQKLNDLHDQILAIIQEKIPPEFKLLNQLLQIESADTIKASLEQNRALITSQFMDLLEEVKTDFESQGQTQLVTRLTKIKEEAKTLTQGGVILRP